MRRITTICLLVLTFSVLHNIYLFNTEDDEGEEGLEGDDDTGLLSRFMSSSIKRVKRRIYYRNETLPTFDAAVFGNRTGRNNTISLIKLLNKNYYIIKKRYFDILANKSMTPPPAVFKGRDYLAKKKAAEAAKKAATGNKTAGTPAAGGAGAPPPPPGGAAAPPPQTSPAPS